MKSTFILFFFISFSAFSQPYVDIASVNYQHSSSAYVDNPNLKNQTSDFNFNLLFPKQFKNGNVLLLRFNSEVLKSSLENTTSTLSSFGLPVGFQLASKSKKWKSVAMFIPKIATDFNGKISSTDFQFGGFFIENYEVNKKLTLKAGMYYNKELFGNFFVPLLGLDWKASDKLNVFGVLPGNFKIEYNLIKDKCYTGFSFKTATRSFNLVAQNKYVFFDEMHAEYFLEYKAFNNIVLFSEVGYSFGKNPILYNSDNKDITSIFSVYSPTKNYPFINFGIAYRIRKD